MRRTALFSIIMLLLALTLLPTASIVAKGPKPEEKANVTVLGDISTIEEVTLNIRRAGRLVIVYGPADLEGITYGDFEDGRELGIRIDKGTGEVAIIYRFDIKDFEGKEWSKYQLTGTGIWSTGSIPIGTITVTDETFTIYEMFYERKGKKGATTVTYEEVWSGLLSFGISITPPP